MKKRDSRPKTRKILYYFNSSTASRPMVPSFLPKSWFLRGRSGGFPKFGSGVDKISSCSPGFRGKSPGRAGRPGLRCSGARRAIAILSPSERNKMKMFLLFRPLKTPLIKRYIKIEGDRRGTGLREAFSFPCRPLFDQSYFSRQPGCCSCPRFPRFLFKKSNFPSKKC